MFTEINGLPVHPLAVHGAVVLVPLAALMGVLFAIPKTRSWARIPLLLTSLAAVGAVFVARQSGFKIKDHLLESRFPYKNLIEEHQSRATVLFVIVIVYALVAVAAYVLTRSGDPSRALATTLSVLLVVGAVAIAFQTFRVGELGSKIVYNPDGNVDFSSD
jgi:cytochrome bd-type quinol oxidase subunit 2